MANSLPPMTPEQRASALEKAAQARSARAGLKASLKAGTLTLSQAISQADSSDAIGKMKVSALIEAVPGMGKAKTRHLMGRLGIVANRRIGSLPASQRAALEAALAPLDA